MSSSAKLPDFWGILNKIKLVLGFSDAQMATILELTDKQYSLLKSRKVTPSLPSVMKLSEYLEIGFMPLVTGNIDYRALAARITRGINQLPMRYAKAAFSKRRTSIYMLDYMTGLFNEGHRQTILRHHQLTEQIFQTPDDPINILFPLDLCEFVKKYQWMDDAGLMKMGQFSSYASRTPTILKALYESKGVKQIYEVMCNEIVGKYFENNYSYKLIKVSENHCIGVGRPNREVEELLGIKNAGTSAICSVRNGFASSFPNYVGLPFARVKKTACVHNGDAECKFEVDYEHATHVFKNPKSNLKMQSLLLN